jgi:hypothetical protein
MSILQPEELFCIIIIIIIIIKARGMYSTKCTRPSRQVKEKPITLQLQRDLV